MISAKDLKEVSGDLTLLFAEDEAMLRESMKGTLEKLFKRVFIASNGQEAYELYKHNEIDIVITDINMPIMSGSELIKQIQEYSEYEPMIIVLSAHNESRLLTSHQYRDKLLYQ